MSLVFGLVMVATAWFLWNGNRWGSIVAIVAQVLNILLAIPWFFDPDPKSLVIGVVVTIVLSGAALWFALSPESRAYWDRRASVAAA